MGSNLTELNPDPAELVPLQRAEPGGRAGQAGCGARGRGGHRRRRLPQRRLRRLGGRGREEEVRAPDARQGLPQRQEEPPERLQVGRMIFMCIQSLQSLSGYLPGLQVA